MNSELVSIMLRAFLSSLWYYWFQLGVRMIEELYTAVCFICPYSLPIPFSHKMFGTCLVAI